jgi:hypothetical protein
MKETMKFDAQALGKKLKIDFKEIPLEQFKMGLQVELEHGNRAKKTNVTSNDPMKTAKIALAHLQEDPKYYSKLKVMEKKK